MASRYPHYLVDTNILSQLYRGNETVKWYWERVPDGHIWVSIITIGEIVKGRVDGALAYQKSKDEARVRAMYSGLFQQYTQDFAGLSICDYTPEALEIMKTMPQTVKASDRRIAAIARAYGYIVVTNDTKDFPHLIDPDQVVDWTIAAE